MIPYATCMCFGKQQPQPWSKKGRGDVVVEHRGNIYHITLKEPEEGLSSTTRVTSALTPSERGLLEELEERPRPVGPFHSPQVSRRGRPQPVVTPEIGRLPHLDSAYEGIAQCHLIRCDLWSFNAFSLDATTSGHAVPVLLLHLFSKYRLLEYFQLDVSKVWRCFSLVEAGYHSENPYHNSVHAADVTQAMHCFLQERKILETMNPLEIMASLIATVCHDLDHPGVNQPFLIATSNHLASLYKNFSVLENHHWRSAMSCLKDSGMLDHLGKDVWDDVEWQVRSLILATDITRQQEFLSRFRRYLDTGVLNMEDLEYRHFILQIALKCADLCNPCRPWEISQRWSYQVCQEFYRQGDLERRLNLPVTPMCDRHTSSIPKIQTDFFKFVVSPLFEIWDRFLGSSLSSNLLGNLQQNHAVWESRITPPVVPPPPSTADAETDEEEPVEEVLTEEEEPSVGGRRHSMPLSLPRLLPRTTIRRQSLPHSRREHEALRHFQLRRSPHISLRTLSASDLMPRTSLLTFSRGASLLRRLEMGLEAERRLVYQPASYPPYAMRSPDPAIFAETSPEDEDKPKCINGCGTPSSEEDTPALPVTWCSKILSTAERAQPHSRDFDVRRPSDRKLVRRGSAPVVSRKPDLRGPLGEELENAPRRWSIPNEDHGGQLKLLIRKTVRNELVRRHSFGLPETSEDFSPPPLPPPFPRLPPGGKRRGSLPASMPRRRGSAGEILCALIGSTLTGDLLGGLWGSPGKWSVSRSQELCSTELLICQRRRGSVPLELTLHSLLTAAPSSPTAD